MHISYQTFKFSLKAEEIILLPSYKGSTFRGGFGNAFKRIVCALKKSDCADCLLKEKCVYSYVFETPPPSDTRIMTKYKNAPHPFIIEPPIEKKQGYKPGDEITFGLTLIGRALDYLPYFIYTFDELGRIGIGKGRGKYELKTVKTIPPLATCHSYLSPTLAKGGRGDSQLKTSGTIYSSDTKTLKSSKPERLSIDVEFSDSKTYDSRPLTFDFLTPARIIYNGHLTLDLEFHMLIRQLLRRLSLLYYFHCGSNPSELDFRGIIEKAKEVKVKERDLRWYDWQRYSARQDTMMKMGGFVGKITFEGDINPFMDLIRAGEVLHVGKGTGFGLGHFKIQDSKFKKKMKVY